MLWMFHPRWHLTEIIILSSSSSETSGTSGTVLPQEALVMDMLVFDCELVLLCIHSNMRSIMCLICAVGSSAQCRLEWRDKETRKGTNSFIQHLTMRFWGREKKIWILLHFKMVQVCVSCFFFSVQSRYVLTQVKIPTIQNVLLFSHTFKKKTSTYLQR